LWLVPPRAQGAAVRLLPALLSITPGCPLNVEHIELARSNDRGKLKSSYSVTGLVGGGDGISTQASLPFSVFAQRETLFAEVSCSFCLLLLFSPPIRLVRRPWFFRGSMCPVSRAGGFRRAWLGIALAHEHHFSGLGIWAAAIPEPSIETK